MMVFVEYHPDGKAIGDFDVEEEFAKFADFQYEADHEYWFTYSTANIVQRICVGIAEGDLDYSGVTFAFKDSQFQVTEYGTPSLWPKGWCEDNYNERILMAGVKRHKERRPKEKQQ